MTDKGKADGPAKIKNAVYEKELFRLQLELVKLQEWIKDQGLKVLVIFEGRDAAGKGGVIKRIVQHLNPRISRSAPWTWSPVPAGWNTPGPRTPCSPPRTSSRHPGTWWVPSDIKKHARLNCIAHLLSMIPYEDLTPQPIELPKRMEHTGYVRPPMDDQTFVPPVYP